MALFPICDKCGKELARFGAILLSPPDSDSKVKKYHICAECFESMEAELLVRPTD